MDSEDDGLYTCVATNDLGTVTSTANLRVIGKRQSDHANCFLMHEVCINTFDLVSCVQRRYQGELEGQH